MKYQYEVVKFDKKIPGRILMQDKPGWRCNTKPHWHEELEFVYMIKGSLNTVTNGVKKRIEPGEFYFCNSKDIHVTSVDDYKEIYTYVVVQLSYKELMNYYMDSTPCYFEIRNERTRELLKIQLDKLMKLHNTKEDETVLLLEIEKNQVILEIYKILLENCISTNQNEAQLLIEKNAYAKQIMEYINEHYKEKISLDVISKEVGLSPQYMSKYFKKATGLGITQYTNMVRVKQANWQMLHEQANVTQAALSNGFGCVKAYISACKEIHGMTPSALMKEIEKTK